MTTTGQGENNIGVNDRWGVPLLRLVLAAVLWIGLSVLSAAHAAAITEFKSTNPLPGAERNALVIGNSAYASIAPLPNPANDARAMAKSLTNVGFNVYQAIDLDRAAMTDVIGRFLNAVTPGSEALIYYAGHGVELEGQNYLLPVDIRQLDPSQQYALRTDGISLTGLLEDLEWRKPRVSLVILDACRNNPFTRPGMRSLGSERGLSRIDPPQGTMVLYAAAAGETALDNLGAGDTTANGLFTRKLLELIERPGLEIRAMVQELKDRVYEAALNEAQHTQRPSYYDGLIGKFYFVPPQAPQPESPPLAVTDPCEVIVRRSMSKSELLLTDPEDGIRACTEALARDPSSSKFTALLEVAKEQRAAQKALLSDLPILSRSYLEVYPDGSFSEEVRVHLASIEKVPETPAVVVPAPAPQLEVVEVAPAPQDEPVPAAPVIDKVALAKELQTELGRVGCSPGTPDGIWGRKSEGALRSFSEKKGIALTSLEPSVDILKQVKATAGRVCPLVCAVTQVEKNGVCVAKTCPKGQQLSSKGQCYTPKVAGPSNGGGGGGGGGGTRKSDCFVFNGNQFCE